MQKIVVAISGASGSLYAKLLIEQLDNHRQVEKLAVIPTPNASTIWREELHGEPMRFSSKTMLCNNTDFEQPFASGSGVWDALVIIPCSMGLLSRVAGGISNDLISRTADVMLKERKRLIVVPRETPYHLIHIENMKQLTLAGGIVLPATPSFYSLPKTVEELCKTVTHRIVDLLGLEQQAFRWGSKK